MLRLTDSEKVEKLLNNIDTNAKTARQGNSNAVVNCAEYQTIVLSQSMLDGAPTNESKNKSY
ncbi:hypothetical protein CW304_16105 [Bacillus sp. UFRGS-B20]|nr:hypothetical protein CW304_16105 [Bacillus sp. UFRGS-B20]